MSDLKRRMALGAAWLVLFRLADRGIGFVSTLILARILVPADFGLVAMGMSILAALELLGSFSFDIALIQNSRAERRHYDTAWTFAVAFGLFNAAAMCLLAKLAADLFSEGRVEGLMYALALCPLIQGLENIGIVAFQKELLLKKEFQLGLTKKLCGFVVTITAAVVFENYWALVCGMLTLRVVGVLLSYRLHPYRPRLSFDAAAELLHFSKWLLLNNLLIFLNNRGTDFVIGRFAGASSLGLYSLSYELANLPTTELVFPISRAVFPGYARLSADLPQLRQAFLQVIGLVALLTVPAGALIGLTAEPLVRTLLGVKWLDAVPLIEVLAVFGIVRSLHGPNGSIYLALGKPRIIAALQCVQLVIAILLMLVLVPRYSSIGAAYAILIGACCAMTASCVVVLRELKMGLTPLAAVIWRPLVGAFAAAGALAASGDLLAAATAGGQVGWAALLRLAIMLSVGAAVYVATVATAWLILGRPDGAESDLLKLVTPRLRNLRGARTDPRSAHERQDIGGHAGKEATDT